MEGKRGIARTVQSMCFPEHFDQTSKTSKTSAGRELRLFKEDVKERMRD